MINVIHLIHVFRCPECLGIVDSLPVATCGVALAKAVRLREERGLAHGVATPAELNASTRGHAGDCPRGWREGERPDSFDP